MEANIQRIIDVTRSGESAYSIFTSFEAIFKRKYLLKRNNNTNNNNNSSGEDSPFTSGFLVLLRLLREAVLPHLSEELHRFVLKLWSALLQVEVAAIEGKEIKNSIVFHNEASTVHRTLLPQWRQSITEALLGHLAEQKFSLGDILTFLDHSVEFETTLWTSIDEVKRKRDTLSAPPSEEEWKSLSALSAQYLTALREAVVQLIGPVWARRRISFSPATEDAPRIESWCRRCIHLDCVTMAVRITTAMEGEGETEPSFKVWKSVKKAIDHSSESDSMRMERVFYWYVENTLDGLSRNDKPQKENVTHPSERQCFSFPWFIPVSKGEGWWRELWRVHKLAPSTVQAPLLQPFIIRFLTLWHYTPPKTAEGTGASVRTVEQQQAYERALEALYRHTLPQCEENASMKGYLDSLYSSMKFL